MVGKGVVLLRIENFEHGAGGVSAHIRRHFVDFVKQQNGIFAPCLLHEINYFSGNSADIGTSVTSDFRFVPHSAETHALENPVETSCYGFGYRRLAHSRRTDETENRTVQRTCKLHYRKIFENALLYLVETEMVLVENFFCAFQILVVLRLKIPCKVGQPLYIAARNSRVGRGGRHLFKTL